jgi:hypothetical protein
MHIELEEMEVLDLKVGAGDLRRKLGLVIDTESRGYKWGFMT